MPFRYPDRDRACARVDLFALLALFRLWTVLCGSRDQEKRVCKEMQRQVKRMIRVCRERVRVRWRCRE